MSRRCVCGSPGSQTSPTRGRRRRRDICARCRSRSTTSGGHARCCAIEKDERPVRACRRTLRAARYRRARPRRGQGAPVRRDVGRHRDPSRRGGVPTNPGVSGENRLVIPQKHNRGNCRTTTPQVHDPRSTVTPHRGSRERRTQINRTHPRPRPRPTCRSLGHGFSGDSSACRC
jgi:hypothetical protein